MKILLNLVGCLAVALGILGIFLPLLPTTQIMLVAIGVGVTIYLSRCVPTLRLPK